MLFLSSLYSQYIQRKTKTNLKNHFQPRDRNLLRLLITFFDEHVSIEHICIAGTTALTGLRLRLIVGYITSTNTACVAKSCTCIDFLLNQLTVLSCEIFQGHSGNAHLGLTSRVKLWKMNLNFWTVSVGFRRNNERYRVLSGPQMNQSQSFNK